MKKLYLYILCILYAQTIGAIGTRSNSVESLDSLDQATCNVLYQPTLPQTMHRDAATTVTVFERLSCCQTIKQAGQTYRNDIKAYGLCFCCYNLQNEKIAHPQVRDCRKKTDGCIATTTCLPFVAMDLFCMGTLRCCYALGFNCEDDF